MNKKLVNIIWVVLVLGICASLIFLLKKPEVGKECNIFSDGKFKYLSGTPDASAYFVVKGDSVIEWNEYGEQYTKSVYEWVAPCQVEIRTVSSSYSDFEFDPNLKVRCEISNVRGDTFNFKMVGEVSTLNFEIVKEK